MVIDECHLVNSKGGMYERFINGLSLPVVGLTATPYRLRSYRHWATGEPTGESRILTRTRPKLFKKIIHITQIGELYASGHLSPVKYVQDLTYNAKAIKSNTTGAGYDDKALLEYNKRMEVINKAVKVVLGTRQNHCLMFTKFRSESQQAVSMIEGNGVSCVEISAETKKRDREQILHDFKSGRIKCVVNVGVLTTGFDFPALDCIILARPTKSVALYYQMVGRGIRVTDDKDFCAVYDLCGNVKQFGKIEEFEIYDQNGNDMWRLRSDVGNLTGTDLTTGENLEKFKNKK
jgi:DNA repair protein RadD